MKKILNISLLAIVGLLFASCNKDLDGNPTIQQPATEEGFVLNVPVYNEDINLSAVDANGNFITNIPLAWSQPAYSFPAVATYRILISTKGTFNKEFDANATPEEQAEADFVTSQLSTTKCNGDLGGEDLAKALQLLEGYDEGSVPERQTVYLKCIASLKGTENVSSNVVSISVIPRYVELSAAQPEIWYMIGGCIGDGKWINSAAAIGVSMIPFGILDGETYDKATGQGKIQYTGYIPEGGEFKIVKEPGNWDIGFCGINGSVYRDGGDDPGNITLDGGAGYYRFTIDTTVPELTIEKLDIAPSEYSTITLPGSQNGWNEASGNALDPVETTASAINHVWTTTVTFEDDAPADGGCKFANGTWDVNWGAVGFPMGVGQQNGANIPYTAGTYRVVFNDITGQYTFIKQ
ncbi:MAG: SusF/SusE family outer membrane protein [Prevotella sp.]|nr:SusF/SusE family outer membrane protein [Prevotella sp.]